jgi:hypothetical protein
MASITISNLNAYGSDLFLDSETFLDDLSDDEMSVNVKGGITPFIASVALSFAIGKAIWE